LRIAYGNRSAVSTGAVNEPKWLARRFCERNGRPGGACIRCLTPQGGECRPVERPGLGNRLLLNVASQLIEPMDKRLGDGTLRRSVRMIFDEGLPRGSALSLDQFGQLGSPAVAGGAISVALGR
jgi:hypothetical protein